MSVDTLAFAIISVVWVIGFARELAWMHSKMNKHGIEYPYPAVKIALPILIFFTWPYWLFYK